jgi:hypothetical protein
VLIFDFLVLLERWAEGEGRASFCEQKEAKKLF